MSRQVSIWYTDRQGNQTSLDVGSADLLGTQEASKSFWSLPIHKNIGIQLLSQLGVTDPVWFTGWKALEKLEQEIVLLEANLKDIPFDEGLKMRWIKNLHTCLEQLKKAAPPDSTPEFMIG